MCLLWHQVILSGLLLVPVFNQALGSYDNPVGSATDDEIIKMPNLIPDIKFKQYSGYLNADKNKTKFLHYWFVEAEEEPSNKPLLLWLNGGPGCSSLGGLFEEIGPFEFSSGSSELDTRQCAWSREANIIFLDGPVGVGFSYSKEESREETDDSTADANYLAIKSFMKKFPQFRDHPLYLAGESYASVYLITLALKLDKDKDINLKGVSIGNGVLDDSLNDESLIYFAYYHGLLGKSDWDLYSNMCCNGKPPTRKSCSNSQKPNCAKQIQSITDKVFTIPGINQYNIYGECSTSSEKQARGSRGLTSTVKESVNNTLTSNKTNLQQPFQNIPCMDTSKLEAYLQDVDVQGLLNIPRARELKPWTICANISYKEEYASRRGGLKKEILSLIKSKRNLTMIMYNGDTDAVCNVIGAKWFMDDLNLKEISEYKQWSVGDDVAGWVQHYQGITYATVLGSGHMVTKFKPVQAYAILETFLHSSGPNVHLEEFSN